MPSAALKKLIANCQAQLDLARKDSDDKVAARTLPKGVQGPNLPSSQTVRGNKEGLAHVREGHSGRRGDILADFHNKEGDYKNRKDDALPPLIMKVSIAGSGGVVMKSQEGKKDVELWRMNDPSADRKLIGGQNAPETYGNVKGDVTFSGPMALGGALDQGANSIDNLVKKVPQVIKANVPPEYKKKKGEGVIILIKAHSRGAVATDIIANKLKSDFPKLKVEVTLFDPVPGPGQRGKKLKNDVAKLDQSTLIYSVASGYGPTTIFTPQKVSGAKRIIISQQLHKGGAMVGYMLDGERYKGSRLNSIPPGAYFETNILDKEPDVGVGVLERMTKDAFMHELGMVQDNKQSTKGTDAKRTATLKKALEKFFEKNG